MAESTVDFLSKKQPISGWGGFPVHHAELLYPSSVSECIQHLQDKQPLITRGAGRSYGDSANADRVMQTNYLDGFIDFQSESGVLTAQAGVLLRDVLRLVVSFGWFLPVTPGSSFVSIGGAIAADVHGKNHEIAGTFSQHVLSITLLLGSGEVVTVSPSQKSDLFHATCGGMGLTGVILQAEVQLTPIRSSYIEQNTVRLKCLEELIDAFETNRRSLYSVAWIDCLARGKTLGRGLLMCGEHAQDEDINVKIKKPIPIPFYAPTKLLNRWTMKAFNTLYYAKAKIGSRRISLMSYFYPLDALGGWNKLYGRPGFLQYQFVIPQDNGLQNMRMLLNEIAQSGEGSFLAVLKRFGDANANPLSFPMKGLTLALDFRRSESTIALMRRLDERVVAMGGRVYLAKDAVMTEQSFKASYPNWQSFQAIREKYSAIGVFSSEQALRLGLL